jgi:hypothetical protein
MSAVGIVENSTTAFALSLCYALSRNYRADVRTLSVVGPEILTRLRGAVRGKGQIGEPPYKPPWP